MLRVINYVKSNQAALASVPGMARRAFASQPVEVLPGLKQYTNLSQNLEEWPKYTPEQEKQIQAALKEIEGKDMDDIFKGMEELARPFPEAYEEFLSTKRAYGDFSSKAKKMQAESDRVIKQVTDEYYWNNKRKKHIFPDLVDKERANIDAIIAKTKKVAAGYRDPNLPLFLDWVDGLQKEIDSQAEAIANSKALINAQIKLVHDAVENIEDMTHEDFRYFMLKFEQYECVAIGADPNDLVDKYEEIDQSIRDGQWWQTAEEKKAAEESGYDNWKSN